MTVSRIRVKIPTKYPSSVSVQSPLALDRTGGAFAFSLSIADLRTTLDALYLPTTAATISDADFTLQDNGDRTKQFQFQLSGITTATTRTWTVPDSSDTFVGKATTDELTNKTLTSSVGKGTWTASGTWTLPAVTLGGAITYGGVTLSNAVTGTGNMVLSAAPTLSGSVNLSSLTLSTALALDASKNIVSVTNTGTGNNVLSASPTLTGTISAAAITASGAVNLSGLTLSTALALDASKNIVSVTNTGSGSNVLNTNPTISGNITFSPTTGGLTGTTTNDNATAGVVGEYLETVIPSGSAVSVTTATDKTIASRSLTAGDWEVDCILAYIPNAATSISRYSASLSLADNTFDATAGRFVQTIIPATVVGALNISVAIPNYRFSLSGTTTIYMVANAAFTVNTLAAWGIIRARRVR